ncbi:MAG: hypothetical protein Athens101426_153 [Parcubacteria group bacterium Athens1014_26]|nr:MAG: hypothetical protein Athens101426_153 [Parcubacteria group bacterium Athens1014_26]
MNGRKGTGGILKSNPNSGTPRTYWVTYVSFACNPGKSGKTGKIETKSLDANGIINILKNPGSEIFVITPLKPGQISGLDQDLAWTLNYVKSLTQGGVKFIKDTYTILRDDLVQIFKEDFSIISVGGEKFIKDAYMILRSDLSGRIKDRLVHRDDLVQILKEDFVFVKMFPHPSRLSTF